MHRRFTAAVVTLVAFAAPAFAGPLNPPAGPIGPTPGPESRTPINATNTPGDANSLFRITQPGSYYLAGPVSGVNAKHGIEIASGNVSIDLRGFSVAGGAGTLTGIATDGVFNTIAIRNGIVTGWGVDGVNLVEGGFGGLAHVVEVVVVSSNAGFGARIGGDAVVRGCSALANGGGGIEVTGGGAMTDCAARDNGSFGLSLGGGGALTGCHTRGNGGGGFITGGSCAVTACAAFINTGVGISSNGATVITACTVQGNTSHGIATAGGVTVFNCAATLNGGDGIRVSTGCIVRNNTCSNNGFSGDGAGIFVGGPDTLVEANNCTSNDRGVEVVVAGNIIVRNVCSGNTTNWNIATGCVFFAVIPNFTSGPVAGVVGGITPGNQDPNVNFSY